LEYYFVKGGQGWVGLFLSPERVPGLEGIST